MQDNDRVLVANKLFNMTSRTLHLYEDVTGSIERFASSEQVLPKVPVDDTYDSRRSSYYVYTFEDFKKILSTHRKVNDIAVIVDSDSHGRHGKKIDYLVWGKDLKTMIRYRRFGICY